MSFMLILMLWLMYACLPWVMKDFMFSNPLFQFQTYSSNNFVTSKAESYPLHDKCLINKVIVLLEELSEAINLCALDHHISFYE